MKLKKIEHCTKLKQIGPGSIFFFFFFGFVWGGGGSRLIHLALIQLASIIQTTISYIIIFFLTRYKIRIHDQYISH